ncbi:PREDICTED: uncharacterized protein LOC109589230 [Amphimedon queenslandica]|uniref:Uncharacterized protein n=1 Tax=Amphimedon queenslandica TaxID=400682 RepID=A0AAN0JV08_AMPQE|nr:PREDICTED: uncharacterized protein LOC109589230 [Amphimedon queenslandica]|eukprot:XP_019860901.1 PREDICTED: uncharacterized protein LOC109589230 [Amphimedon queenslandica]
MEDSHQPQCCRPAARTSDSSVNYQTRRLHQLRQLFLFSPSSGLYSCPLPMTDGGARLIELSYADMLKRVDPLCKELKDLETKAEDTRQKRRRNNKNNSRT